MKMCLKLYLLVLILKLTCARYANMVPKFYAQDSAIIVDTDKQLPAPPLYRPMQYYPVYHIVKPMQPTTPRSTSTDSPLLPQSSTGGTAYTPNEFPVDLLHIAQHKLGLKRLEEIPSIGELGELLGTSSDKETIKYIRQLTTTEQGIALMKAYIESTDYTNSARDEAAEMQEEIALNEATTNDEYVDEEEEAQQLAKLTRIKQRATKTQLEQAANLEHRVGNDLKVVLPSNPTPTPGFLDRMFSYFNLHNLWPAKVELVRKVENMPTAAPAATHALSRVRLHKQQQFPPAFLPTQPLHVDLKRPLLVRPPLPYHFPIPLRPALPTPSTPAPTSSLTPVLPNTSTVHLNTPKALPPHVQNLLNMAARRIPAKKLEILLQHKPKLAELAAKASRFPLAHDGGALIDAQLLAVLQKAIEQDDDLKKLLSAAETLK